MAASSEVSEIAQKLQRDINCLGDENRSSRRRALERLRRETVDYSPAYTAGQLQGLCEVLVKPLLRTLSDQVEKCRELSISIITQFIEGVEEPAVFLPLLVPVTVARLAGPDISEPSEELRLSLVRLLTLAVRLCGGSMAPYLNDLILILQRTIVDPFPDVKKESCVCVCLLAESIPATFHQQSETLCKPLYHSMTHQHSKVRLACVKALGATIRYGSPTPLSDALPLLAQRACDSTPSVRSCLVDVVATLLLELPDRYSYFHKLLPLLLTCMSDELPEIRCKSHDLWSKVGTQYESENEEELKDKMDFSTVIDPSPLLEFGRPNLGCRVLVYRNFSKILPALLGDLTDWTANSRIKSSQLLFVLLCHLEEHTTHHVQAVLTGLYSAGQDEENIVLEQVAKCCNVIGYYVSAEVWCQLVLPAVRTSAGCKVRGTDQASTVAVGPVQANSCLQVLVSILGGVRADAVQPHLQRVVECLCEPELGQTEHLALVSSLLAGLKGVASLASDLSHDMSHQLFTALLRVQASRHAAALNPQIESVLQILCSKQGYDSVHPLYLAHTKQILQQLRTGYTDWSVHSPNCSLFSSLLSGGGQVIASLLDDTLPILTTCIRPDADPEMRLHFITLLIRLLIEAGSDGNSSNQFDGFAVVVVTDIIVPNCVWKGGRTAAAVRTAAMTALQALLQSSLLTAQQFNTVSSQLMPKLLSCLDDDNHSTRLVTAKVLQLILKQMSSVINTDRLHLLYPDLLKRLDDSNDEIRIAVTHTLTAFIEAMPEDYDNTLYGAHLEELYKGLLVHLDDPLTHIQEAVLAVLKTAARLDAHKLSQQVQSVKHKHRDSSYCDQLLEYLGSVKQKYEQ